MLVEDEYLLNKTITTYLRSKDFEVDGFLDGMEALDAINSGYDLVILDIDIPRISGIEILEQIRLLHPELPVIMISATIDMEVITKAYTKGCNDYLKKPFDIKELELKIRAFTRAVAAKIAFGDDLFYMIHEKQLRYKDEVIVLTPKENMLVSLLIENRGRIIPNEYLELAIWNTDEKQAHLRQLVNRLRKKLPVDIIKNQIGKGYEII